MLDNRFVSVTELPYRIAENSPHANALPDCKAFYGLIQYARYKLEAMRGVRFISLEAASNHFAAVGDDVVLVHGKLILPAHPDIVDYWGWIEDRRDTDNSIIYNPSADKIYNRDDFVTAYSVHDMTTYTAAEALAQARAEAQGEKYEFTAFRALLFF